MNTKLEDYYPLTHGNHLKWPHSQLLVDRRHRLLFCPIGKNACSSLKRLIVTLSDLDHKELINQDVHVHIDRFTTGAKLLDYSGDEARQMMQSPDYFKFAVVRDPFERLVSAYIEKFVINRLMEPQHVHTGPVVGAIQGTGSPDYEIGISFAEFVRYVTTQNPEQLDNHWRLQSSYLRGVCYDRIYRLDELDELRSDLVERTGVPIEIGNWNRSSSTDSRFVPGASSMLPGELEKPAQIHRRSFMENELIFRIVTYFMEDYLIYYS